MRQLEGLGVEVMLGNAVTACDAEGLTLSGGQRILTSSIVWAAGVMASPAAKWLGEASDRAGRVPIGPDLSLVEVNDASTIIQEAAQSLGYTPEQISEVPGGSNLGLGCGNPQTIASLQGGEVVLDSGQRSGI